MYLNAVTFATLKYILVIVLLLSMLGETFSRYILVLDYQLNKKYIAQNLCENRDKPDMKCEGKCYLCKRLKKEDKKDEESPERKTKNENQLLFSETNDGVATLDVNSPGINYALSASDNQTFDQPSFCFHPPD